MIIKVDFEQVLNIWKNHLWLNRTSQIESHSAMLLNKTYDIKNFEYQSTYFVYVVDGVIAGCNSGHMCSDLTYRSRGLFVFPEFRKKGKGVRLLKATIDQAMQEKATCVWSYPRQSSWSTYAAAGFELSSDWEQGETGINAYCMRKI